MKIKIHPLFVVVAALIVWKCGFSAFLASIISVLLHELAHAYAAKGRGYVADNVLLLPYGAVLYNRNNLDRTSNVIIALAGPLCNFLVSLLFISFWWLIPSSYGFTKIFVESNLFIGLFNLLPVYPLDGARIIFAITGYKPKTQKILKFAGVVLSLTLAVLFFVYVNQKPNFTLLIMSLFLLFAAVSSGEKEDYDFIRLTTPLIKDFENGVTQNVVFLSDEATLKKALLMIKPDKLLTFMITQNGRVVACIKERDMQLLFNSNPLTMKFKKLFSETPELLNAHGSGIDHNI